MDDDATSRISHADEVAADPQRLRVLGELGLLDRRDDDPFDRLTDLVRRLLDVPVALVTFVDAYQQMFAGMTGLPEQIANEGCTPLSYSFCKHVVADDEPLEVPDAREVPHLLANPAVCEFGIRAYLGVPLRAPSGHTLGALCAVDMKPRRWDDRDRRALADVASMVVSEIAARQMTRSRPDDTADIRQQLEQYRQQLRDLTQRLCRAESAERQRLSLVLHDNLQQLLVSAHLRVQMLEGAVPAGVAGGGPLSRGDPVGEVRSLLHECIQATRELTEDLYPVGLRRDDLDAAIAWLAKQFEQRHELKVGVAGRTGAVGPTATQVLFGAARELLFNVVKHAGVDEATVRLERDGDLIELCVIDGGCGFPEPPGDTPEGLGLTSLRERVAALGGSVTIDNAGSGACVRVRMDADLDD